MAQKVKREGSTGRIEGLQIPSSLHLIKSGKRPEAYSSRHLPPKIPHFHTKKAGISKGSIARREGLQNR